MKRFVFLDLETTGLDELVCSPIEVAAVVTDEQLVELGSFERLIIPRFGCLWDAEARVMHSDNGLAQLVEREGRSLVIAQILLPEFISSFAGPDISLHLAGYGVHFDRRFLKRYFPDVERLFHHRHLDVSSIRMLAETAGHPPLSGEKRHRAMLDVRRSLDDARRFLGVLRCR